MHLRVVRFTDVDRDRMDALKARIDENSGPPEGVDSTGIQIVLDAEQGTAVVIQQFESEEKMRSSEEALNAMDPGDTPGTRASVDRGEVIAVASA